MLVNGPGYRLSDRTLDSFLIVPEQTKFQNEIGEDGQRGAHAEHADLGGGRERADAEGERVGDGRDGDGRPDVEHHRRHSTSDGQMLLQSSFVHMSSPRVNDQKCVVNS